GQRARRAVSARRELRHGAHGGLRMRDTRRRVVHTGIRPRGRGRDGRARPAGRSGSARGRARRSAPRRGTPPTPRGRRPGCCRGALFVEAHRRPPRRDLQRAGGHSRSRVRRRGVRLPHWFSRFQHPLVRLALVAMVAASVVALTLWRGPNFGLVGSAFSAVEWRWVAVAVAINFVSVVVRSIAWKIVVDQALPPPHPATRSVFAAFCVGLLANAALPGRVGELARVGVLARRVPRRAGAWAAIAGSVFAHRMFDVLASAILIVFVLYTAKIPDWASRALGIVLGIGLGLLLFALLLARRHHRPLSEELGPVRRLVSMARQGLAVLHRPLPAVGAL